MNINEIMQVKGNEVTKYADVNASVLTIVDAIATGRRADKRIAEAFDSLVSSENRDNAFLELGAYTVKDSGKKALPFPKAIERIFNGEYSGATAYRYAKLCAAFKGTSEWDDFSIGKLSILYSLKEKDTPISETLDKLYITIGKVFCDYTLEKWNEWRVENSDALQTIAILRTAGAPENLIKSQSEHIPAEPAVIGYTENDKGEWEFNELETGQKGYEIVKAKPDAWLKERLSEMKGKKEVDPDKLKDSAKKALEKYIETLSEVPDVLKNAIAVLEK